MFPVTSKIVWAMNALWMHRGPCSSIQRHCFSVNGLCALLHLPLMRASFRHHTWVPYKCQSFFLKENFPGCWHSNSLSSPVNKYIYISWNIPLSLPLSGLLLLALRGQGSLPAEKLEICSGHNTMDCLHLDSRRVAFQKTDCFGKPLTSPEGFAHSAWSPFHL